MSRMSIATIDKPEFINLQPLEINPLMSACEIKVFYLGANRNKSFIDKDTAIEMSKTLRGAPIVGHYRQNAQDFGDHGEQIIIDDEGVKFNCLTQPYGFVAPDAKVWFQKFEETDEYGNKITREYLMTTGYLWTGQFEEAKAVFESSNGKPHSMELDKNSLNGHWTDDINTGMELFIVNDAIFSKLCILGEDVEPCFEGSSVTAPQVSASFTKVDDNFKKTLYNMMQELRFALEGGKMELENNNIKEVIETPAEDEATAIVEENSVETQDNSNEENIENTENNIEDTTSTDFVKKEDEEDSKEDTSNEEKSTEEKDSENSKDEEETEEDDKKDKKPNANSSLETEYNELKLQFEKLQNQFSDLSQKCEELTSYKNKIEDAKKDELIDKFSMLSDEDKKDVIENKAKYSLEEIESKLSVIGFRNGVNFSLNTEEEAEEPTQYTVNVEDTNSLPDWVKAVKEVEKNL